MDPPTPNDHSKRRPADCTPCCFCVPRQPKKRAPAVAGRCLWLLYVTPGATHRDTIQPTDTTHKHKVQAALRIYGVHTHCADTPPDNNNNKAIQAINLWSVPPDRYTAQHMCTCMYGSTHHTQSLPAFTHTPVLHSTMTTDNTQTS